jgi:Tol biopolymer transport system component
MNVVTCSSGSVDRHHKSGQSDQQRSRSEQHQRRSDDPTISADGRYVAFISHWNNLVSGDLNSWEDIYVRDQLAGTTTRVSVSSAGGDSNDRNMGPVIDAAVSHVAYWSTNLVTGDSNDAPDVFVRNLRTGVTQRVSLSSTNAQANGAMNRPGDLGDSDHCIPAGAAGALW